MALQDVRLDANTEDAIFTVEPPRGARVEDRTRGGRHHLVTGLGSWGRPAHV
jgi:hypothetical protein